jgi:hypothetical protein
MRACVHSILMISLLLTACEKKGDRILIEETRRSTTKDFSVKLFATSDERFRDSKPSPVEGETPDGWLKLPGKEMRVLNYRFGGSGLGEVYVTILGGGVKENVERWFKQFGGMGLSAEDFNAMERLAILGGEGVWVEATGSYNQGPMGGGVKSDYGLAGVVAEVGGAILTVKMVGPKEEVDAEKANLRAYVASLKVAEK